MISAESLALLIAATLNAGTVVALASLGLLINERAGVLNLGAEGMMLVAAIAGYAACVHTGSDVIGFAAAAGARALLAAGLGGPGHLAGHQPVRHGAGAQPVRGGPERFRRHHLHAAAPARAGQPRHPLPGRPAFRRPGPVQAAPAGLHHHRAGGGADLVPDAFAGGPGAARGGRVARVGACAGLRGAAHSPGRRVRGRGAVRRGRGLHLAGLHPAVGGRHGGRQGLDRPGPDDLCHLAAAARAAGGLPLRWRDDAAVPVAGAGGADPVPVADDAALPRHHRCAGADLSQPDVDPHQHACFTRQTLPSGRLSGHDRCVVHRIQAVPNPGDDMTTPVSKRSVLKLAGLAALTATAALVGCGKKEAAPEAASAASEAPASAAAVAAAPLKIAFAYVGPVGDAGWTYAHNQGRLAVEKEFGDKVVTSFVEKVPEGQAALVVGVGP